MKISALRQRSRNMARSGLVFRLQYAFHLTSCYVPQMKLLLQVGTRSGGQCRERFMNCLKPNVKNKVCLPRRVRSSSSTNCRLTPTVRFHYSWHCTHICCQHQGWTNEEDLMLRQLVCDLQSRGCVLHLDTETTALHECSSGGKSAIPSLRNAMSQKYLFSWQLVAEKLGGNIPYLSSQS
jgi:hypothetical protein